VSVDFHLSKAIGIASEDKRAFAARIAKAQEAAGRDWTGRTGNFVPQADDLHGLPDNSWFLDIEFKLRKPYTSKGEIEFSEVQSPIVRDQLTSLPTVMPATWKGHLAFAARTQDIEGAVRERLFGAIRGDESGQAGRLHFFPTFFSSQTAREVITPLWRDTRTPARGPIDIEVIAAGQHAKFFLLYVPRPKGDKWHIDQIGEDLYAAARSVKAMLLDYGFSAKKTSGWGAVADSLMSGVLVVKGLQWPQTMTPTSMAKSFVEPEEVFLNFMDTFGRPLTQLKKITGEWLSNKEFRASNLNLGSLGVYRKFRDWYERHGAEWERKVTVPTTAATAALRTYELQAVSEFVRLAEGLRSSLRRRADA